ncbi:MAG: MFS transporter [Planctomycetota bacterium]
MIKKTVTGRAGPLLKKFSILAASVVVQACLGGLYAWSKFVPLLIDGYGLSGAQTQLIFGCLIAVFSITMVFAGRWIERFGPARVSVFGGLLFGAGYITASFSGGAFSLLLLGISGLAGIGTGLCYICALAMCAVWFPKHRGLAMGATVAGFGSGAALLTAFAGTLLDAGHDILVIFRFIGFSYGIVIMTAACVLRHPPDHPPKPGVALFDRRAILKDRFFWGLATGMFSGTFAGLLVIGNLKPIALAAGIPVNTALSGIMTFAAGNALGRIVWGWASDRWGETAVPVSLALLAVALASVATHHSVGFLIASGSVGFGFGACFVVYAAQVGARYGADAVESIYPMVSLTYGLSGIAGPWAGGLAFDLTGSYASSIGIAIIVVIVGAFISQRLRAARPKS